jgi:hypothetical protein
VIALSGLRGLRRNAVANDAVALAAATCPPFLLSHNYRTFLFGRMLVPTDLDEEAAFVASMLHDIGLVQPHSIASSFELLGAAAAEAFLRSHNWAHDRIQLVEQAIILHIEQDPLDVPEMRVFQLGAAFDMYGLLTDSIETAEIDAILAAHPRGTMAADIRNLVAAEIVRRPRGAFAKLETQHALSELVARNPLDNRGPQPVRPHPRQGTWNRIPKKRTRETQHG